MLARDNVTAIWVPVSTVATPRDAFRTFPIDPSAEDERSYYAP